MLALHRPSRPAREARAAAAPSRPRLRPWYGLLSLAALGVALILRAPSAEAQSPVLDVVSELLKNAAAAAATELWPAAFSIALSLATIELVVFALAWRNDRMTIAFPLRGLAVRIAWWSWILFLLIGYSSRPHFSVGHLLIEGGQDLAALVSDVDGFAPHAVLAQGWTITLEFAEVLFGIGIRGFAFFGGTESLGAFSILALDLLLILASYYIVALALYLLIFQSLLTLAVGPFFVAFGASRWTARLHDGYLTFAFSLALKMILFGIVLRVGDDVTAVLLQLIDVLADLEPAAILDSTIPITLTLASLSYALGAMLTGPVAARLTAGTFEIASAILPQRSS